MNIYFIKSPEKKEIVAQLKERFGIDEIPYLLIESGKEKIRAFSGTMNKDEIVELAKIAPIESIGIYLIKREHDFRLSLDATQLLKDKITKNVIEITDINYEEWIRGYNLPIVVPNGTYIIKYKTDFIGCAKSNGEVLINHVPKERRLKTKLPINETEDKEEFSN